MSEFKLYEVTSYNDVEISNTHTIEEILSLEQSLANILIQWFYQEDGDKLRYDFNESRHYITLYGDTLLEIVSELEQVLNTNSIVERNMKILHFFPKIHSLTENYSKDDLFSEEYYDNFKILYEELKKIVPSNTVSNRERLFLYNIQW